MKLVHERERGCELLAQKRARQQERERGCTPACELTMGLDRDKKAARSC
jgi:hypothetical protein